MGAAPSVQADVYKQTLVPFFVEEYDRINKLALSGEALAAAFHDALVAKVPEFRSKVIFESSQSGKHVDLTRTGNLPEMCHRTLSRIMARNSFSHIICLDGHESSDLALGWAFKMRRRLDRFVLFHVWNEAEQASLHPHFRKDALKARYENLCLDKGMTSSDLEDLFLFRERGDDDDAKNVLVSVIDEYETERRGLLEPGQSYYLPTKSLDFAFIGYSLGKDVEGGGGVGTVLGTSRDHSLRHIHLPVIVIKNRLPEDASRGLTFCVCVNNSERAKRGLAVVLALMKPRDKLVCLHVISDEEGFAGDRGEEALREVKAYFDKECELFGPTEWGFIAVPTTNKSRVDSIVAWVAENSPDFVCIAPRVRIDPSAETSSVTSGIIHAINTNIILVKNHISESVE